MKRYSQNFRGIWRVILGSVALILVGGLFHAPQALAQADKRPDLVVGIAKLPTNFQPARFSNTHNRIKMIYVDHFVRRDFGATPEGDGIDLVPGLATEWKQVSPTVWEFKVRRGVKFQNGEEMTAEDVAFTFSAERMWGPKPAEAGGRRYFNKNIIKAVTATGPYIVRIETKSPDAIMPLRFASPVGFIVPKKYYQKLGPKKYFLAPIGTGPYKMAKFERGNFIRFEAFDGYWRGKPPVKSITLRQVPELSARVAGLLSGEFDIITDVTPELVGMIDGKKDLKTVKVKYENQIVIVTSTLHPVTADKRIRKALVHALDRQKMVKALWGDATYVPKPFSFKFYGKYYNDKRQPRAYDPGKAKALLKAAGYKGQTLNLRIQKGGYPKIEDAAQIMVEMWKAVGINVKLEVRDGSKLAAKGINKGKVAMISWSNGIHIPDPVTPIWATWGPDGPRAPGKRESSWKHPESFVKLGRKFEKATDFKERNKLFQQLIDGWLEESPGFALWMRADWFAMKKNISWKPYSFFYLDFGPGNLKVKN